MNATFIRDNWDSLTGDECRQAAEQFKAAIEAAGKVNDLDSQQALSPWVCKLEEREKGIKAGKIKPIGRVEKRSSRDLLDCRTADDALALVLGFLRQARDLAVVQQDARAMDALNEAGLSVQECMKGRAAK